MPGGAWLGGLGFPTGAGPGVPGLPEAGGVGAADPSGSVGANGVAPPCWLGWLGWLGWLFGAPGEAARVGVLRGDCSCGAVVGTFPPAARGSAGGVNARHITYDTGGAVAAVEDTGLDGFTPYTPAGEVSICSPEPAPYTTQVCRCDDTDGDGIGDADYVEVVEIDADGAMTTVGTYNADMSAPYEPVNPVECPVQGAPPVHGVRAGRVELADGSSWNAAGVPLLQSVTAAAHGGTGTITTADGTTTLFQGESVTWSVVRDDDAMLTGPLTIAAQTGTVTISYTQGVLL
ncbi:hypothetical protein SAMN05443665_101715 [Actinomadura meyerae]|uniref:Uncharacterized protein n=1 Tax=Actinomadura meyerae TaxID=240840 RepID=A0A239K5J4_9ACTN|nr:hypothetical protein [Actinomadura meyerae]SNT13647.1 hypothetical protein SAMN05443665_101715 [Actinomadura meyerae]